MGLAWLLALQTAAAPAPQAPARIDFDLAKVKPAAAAPLLPCAPGEAEAIVVCGRRERASPRLEQVLPDEEPWMDQLSDRLHVKLGPVEIGSFKNRDGTRGFGLRMRF